MPWQDSAACGNDNISSEIREKYGDIYFEAEPGSEAERLALAKCATCPVRLECVTLGLNHGSRDENDILTPWGNGIWGGKTEKELREYLNEDARGRPLKKLNPKKLSCPHCGQKTIVPLQTKRTKKQLSCTYCGVTWWARIMVNVVLLNDEMDNDISTSVSDESWNENTPTTGNDGSGGY